MKRPFTGRHMLAIMIGFFGVVIAVNFTMATLAEETFGGTVVDNSYVASQQFNSWLAAARAQERLGWHAEPGLDSRRRVVVAVQGGSRPLIGAQVEAVASHPVGAAPDIALAFRPDGAGHYVALAPLPAGRWLVQFTIKSGGREMRLIESLS
jgi:nitrogen fixation protein FixH